MTTNLTGVGYSLQGVAILVQYDTVIYPYLKTYRAQISNAISDIYRNGGEIYMVSHKVDPYYIAEMAKLMGSMVQYNKKIISGMPDGRNPMSLARFFNQWFYLSGNVRSYKSVLYVDSDALMRMYAASIGMQTCNVDIFITPMLSPCLMVVAKNNINYGAHGALATHTMSPGLY